MIHLGLSNGSLRHLSVNSCKKSPVLSKNRHEGTCGHPRSSEDNSLNKAPGHNKESLNAKEIMIYWAMRLIKGKGWQARESEKLRFPKLNFLKRPISEDSTLSFDSPYRLGFKVEDGGDSL